MGDMLNDSDIMWAMNEINEFPQCDGNVEIGLKEYNELILQNERLNKQVCELKKYISDIMHKSDSQIIVITKNDEYYQIDFCNFDGMKDEIEKQLGIDINDVNEHREEMEKDLAQLSQLVSDKAALELKLKKLRERGLWKRILNKE